MQHITERLNAFLNSDQPGVAAIKGAWGVGKTYFITNYIMNEAPIREERTAIVSLFGLSSIDELKEQIFPATRRTADLQKTGKDAGMFWKLYQLSKKLPYVDEGGAALKEIELSRSKNMLIIFDDLERKHSTLRMGSFLGLVNFFSEQQQCKIIIILNEDQLSKRDEEELTRLREKLIDLEVLYAPTYEYNVKLFFAHRELLADALDIFRRCDCRNLRVIKRCHDNCLIFEKHFAALGTESRHMLLRQVILISCLYYQRGSDIDFDSAIRKMAERLFGRPDDKSTFKGDELLRNAEFRTTDFDPMILSFLQSGTVDPAAAELILSDKRHTEKQEARIISLQKIYGLFNSNFLGEKEDFVTQLSSFLDQWAPQLTWPELSLAISKLKQVDDSLSCDRWIDNYIISNGTAFTFEQCRDFDSLANAPEAKAAISGRRAAILTKRPVKEIVYSIAEKQTWDVDDIVILKQQSAEDFANWLESEDDERLLRFLREFASMFNPESGDPDCQEIGSTLFEAFRKIGTRNDFIQLKLINVRGISSEILKSPPS